MQKYTRKNSQYGKKTTGAPFSLPFNDLEDFSIPIQKRKSVHKAFDKSVFRLEFQRFDNLTWCHLSTASARSPASPTGDAASNEALASSADTFSEHSY